MAKTKIRQVRSMVFAGMEEHIDKQLEAIAVFRGEELTEEMRKPLGDVSKLAGEIEMNAPLFFGQVHPTLF